MLRAEVLRIGEQIEAATTSNEPHGEAREDELSPECAQAIVDSLSDAGSERVLLRLKGQPRLVFNPEELSFIWKRYALAPAETLTPAANALRENLLAAFEQVSQRGVWTKEEIDWAKEWGMVRAEAINWDADESPQN